MLPRDRTLQELASEAGFGVGNLASLIGAHRTTVQKHWASADWFERFTPTSIAKIISLVPGADSAVRASALRTRRLKITESLEARGVTVDDEVLDAATLDPEIEPQFLLTALEAAAHIVSEHEKKAVDCLQTLWGRSQTRALDAVFGTHPQYRVIEQPALLTEAARATLASIEGSNSTAARAIAQAHLHHHIAKTGMQLVIDGIDRSDGSRRTARGEQRDAFIKRGNITGRMRNEDDCDIAAEYHRLVSRYPVAQAVEAWAFPSWSGDVDSRDEFSLPKTFQLTRTADEIIHEIETYNDAYVLYLLQTFIPLALEELDRDFGGQLPKLVVALKNRAEKTELKELKDEAEKLARHIAPAVASLTQ